MSENFSDTLRAIIVDDEKLSRENLEAMIRNHCPEIELAGIAENAQKAKFLLDEYEPDVLFLDINMPHVNGFELLDSIPDRDFCVVFVTAHNEYGVQAIKANAVDYLLKPIDLDDLQNATQKLVEKVKELRTLRASKKGKIEKLQKIIINNYHGFSVLGIDKIIRLEAASNYTKIIVIDQPPITSSKTLRDFEEILDPKSFYRIHKSHIINLHFMQEYSKIDGGFAIMSDGSRIMISRRRFQDFLERIKEFTLFIK